MDGEVARRSADGRDLHSPHTIPDEGFVLPRSEHCLPRLPGTVQSTTTGSPAWTPNETHKNPPVNGPPSDSSMHVEENWRLTSNIHSPPMSSTFTRLIDQRVLHNILSTPSKDACGPETKTRTRGVFVIGCSAPVRVDEGIEVYLRSGANGEVDFII